MLTPHVKLKVTFLTVGGVIGLAGWFLLGFDAIYLASFPLSRSGAVLPATVLLLEVGLWLPSFTGIGGSAPVT